jgi:hypothetical protein
MALEHRQRARLLSQELAVARDPQSEFQVDHPLHLCHLRRMDQQGSHLHLTPLPNLREEVKHISGAVLRGGDDSKCTQINCSAQNMFTWST